MIKNPVVILKDIDRLKRLVEDLKAEYNINDFDIKIYDAEKIELEKILSEFDYNPIFSQKSLFIIKNVENFSKNDCEKLYKTIKKLTSDIIIILYGISINPPFEESKLKKEPVSPENIFFKRIYELKEKDRKKIIETLRDYMKSREKNFSPLISGIEIYLRNILYKERKLKEETIKNFDLLYNLDYFLKTGVIEAGSELEIYLFFYFFSVSS
jgi:DNA polymerase III delta subunit